MSFTQKLDLVLEFLDQGEVEMKQLQLGTFAGPAASKPDFHHDFVVSDVKGREHKYIIFIEWEEDEECYTVSFITNDDGPELQYPNPKATSWEP